MIFDLLVWSKKVFPVIASCQ